MIHFAPTAPKENFCAFGVRERIGAHGVETGMGRERRDQEIHVGCCLFRRGIAEAHLNLLQDTTCR
jgi:hypothetical protein